MGNLSLALVEKYRRLAEQKKVSQVARSRRGFLAAFRRAGGRLTRLSPEWRRKRAAFIKRHTAQALKRGEPMYDKFGHPTRRHLALIMWAASPSPAKLRKAVRERRVTSRYVYEKATKLPKSAFDPRSFRTKRIGRHGRLLRVACLKGEWGRRRCRGSMKAYEWLIPERWAWRYKVKAGSKRGKVSRLPVDVKRLLKLKRA